MILKIPLAASAARTAFPFKNLIDTALFETTQAENMQLSQLLPLEIAIEGIPSITVSFVTTPAKPTVKSVEEKAAVDGKSKV